MLLLTLFLSISLIGISYADFEDGVKAYEEYDNEVALYEFEPLAKQGNAKAQYYLGLLLAGGRAPESYLEKIKSYTIINNKKYYKDRVLFSGIEPSIVHIKKTYLELVKHIKQTDDFFYEKLSKKFIIKGD